MGWVWVGRSRGEKEGVLAHCPFLKESNEMGHAFCSILSSSFVSAWGSFGLLPMGKAESKGSNATRGKKRFLCVVLFFIVVHFSLSVFCTYASWCEYVSRVVEPPIVCVCTRCLFVYVSVPTHPPTHPTQSPVIFQLNPDEVLVVSYRVVEHPKRHVQGLPSHGAQPKEEESQVPVYEWIGGWVDESKE